MDNKIKDFLIDLIAAGGDCYPLVEYRSMSCYEDWLIPFGSRHCPVCSVLTGIQAALRR